MAKPMRKSQVRLQALTRKAQAPVLVNATMPDGTVRTFDAANEPRPGCEGNNKSREGFLYNCYFHPLGKFFQHTIKGAIMQTIRRVHDTEIPRYDRQAYVYDDPRLRTLDEILTGAILTLINDTERAHKQEILLDLKDICLFMLKEDVYYRPRILQGSVDVAKMIIANEQALTTMSDREAYNMARYADGKDHAPDFSDLPMEERLKLPKHWTGLP